MVLLDFVGDRDLRIPLESNSDRAPCGGSCARRRGASAPATPSRPGPGPGRRRPHPLHPAGRALDRPDRLRLPLLAPPLRRPDGRLRAQRRRGRGRPSSSCCGSAESLACESDGRRPREAPPGRAARLLRGRGPRRPDRRARARAVRPAGLRAQGDRPQQARRRAAPRARRGLRRGGDRGAGGRDGGLLGPRRVPGRARERRGAPAQDDRRHLPARHEGARGGEEVRRRGLHDRPDRPRGPRGGRGHDGRGARPLRARRDRGRRRQPRARRTPTGSPTSRRPRSASTRPTASSAACASASRTSPGRSPTTSVTRPRTASWPSARWPASATSCS